MKGKATTAWKRMHLLSDLIKNRSYMEVKQKAQDRAGWRVGSSRRLEEEERRIEGFHARTG